MLGGPAPRGGSRRLYRTPTGVPDRPRRRDSTPRDRGLDPHMAGAAETAVETAERHVREGEKRVASRIALISAMDRDGHPDVARRAWAERTSSA